MHLAALISSRGTEGNGSLCSIKSLLVLVTMMA